MQNFHKQKKVIDAQYGRTIKEPHLPYKTGLDVTQSHSLRCGRRIHDGKIVLICQFINVRRAHLASGQAPTALRKILG